MNDVFCLGAVILIFVLACAISPAIDPISFTIIVSMFVDKLVEVNR